MPPLADFPAKLEQHGPGRCPSDAGMGLSVVRDSQALCLPRDQKERKECKRAPRCPLIDSMRLH